MTAVVVKNDRMEFQLDGGGFGTFLDDSSTTVVPKTVDKSDCEKRLERDLASATDDDQRRKLQRDLDRERARRERQEADNRAAAQVAGRIKAQKVASDRLRGGSRFNLRWQGAIPEDQKTPDAVMKLLADYVSFDSCSASCSSACDAEHCRRCEYPSNGTTQAGHEDKRGHELIGQGKQLSESVSGDGLKTQTIEYASGDRRVDVTYVEGVVVRYSISSN